MGPLWDLAVLRLFVPSLMVAFALRPAVADPLPWSDTLVDDGGGAWRARAVVTVVNGGERAVEGEPFSLPIGRKCGQIDLVGQGAEAVRVCDDLGRELLFDLTDAAGCRKRRGMPAAGDRLSFCVTCEAAKKSAGQSGPGRSCYVVYYDNPDADAVSDYLSATLANGGFEQGDDQPTGWNQRSTDETHVASWVEDGQRSGKRCARVVVKPGAEPTWVQWVQGDIAVAPGARYRLSGWVRAEDVKGKAGWYVHVHGDKPMVVNKVGNAGDGTYDWRKVTFEFDTPSDARSAAVGTVLHGTGKASFDDATLERLSPASGVKVESVTTERRELKEIAGRSDWLLPAMVWPYRATVTATNTSDSPARNVVVLTNLCRAVRQVARNGRSARVVVIDPSGQARRSVDDALASCRLGPQQLFVATLPKRSRKAFHVYMAPGPPLDEAAQRAQFLALVRSPANLVKNADFESGGAMPDGWRQGGGKPEKGKPQCKMARVTGGIVGEHCARLDVPAGARLQWSGWVQEPVPVQPNTRYLYAGWLKTQQVDGHVALHGHHHAADGKLVKTTPFFSTPGRVSGDSDWTLSHALVQTPGDSVTVSLHLTMNAHGMVWHDGIVLCRVAEARVGGGLETAKPIKSSGRGWLRVWQVNPLVKVFRDDPPNQRPTSLNLSAAANEYEPVQLAIRSDRPLKDVCVEVTALRGKGRSLPAVQIDRVGYVPVDVASAYYVSRLPSWYRLVPRGAPRTDGWAGDWPDPLPPCTPFDMPAKQTQPIWLTVHVPPGTPAGTYCGQVTVRSGGQTLEQLPISVTVWPFELPARPSLRVIYDLRRGRRANPFGDGSIDEMRKWYTLLAQHRVSPGLLPSPVFKYKDGKVEMDTRAFDAAARVCIDELHMNVFYSAHLFYAFGWGYKPRPLFGHEAFTDEYKRAFTTCYRAYLDHLKRRGWYDELVNYISDEPHFSHEHVVEQMKRICELAHSVDPKVPLYSSTWRHVPDWDGQLDIWGVGQYGCFPVEEMKRRQADGQRIWFTTDGQQALDTPYLATERLLPYYCFKYGVTGYEFWGVSWWTHDPWDRAWHKFISQSDDGTKRYWVRYPNGDGYLTYPGGRVGLDRPVSSIRLEQAREGVEDYEYLCILRDLVKRGRDKLPADAIRAAEAALDRARSLVTIPNAGGMRSTEILPDPDVVAPVRSAVAEQIVKLGALSGG